MIHWLISPKQVALAKYIDCYWFIKKSPDADGYEPLKLNPDPAAHLLLSEVEQAYQNQIDAEVSSGRGSHLIFPHVKTFQLDHSQLFSYLGIKFKVGALYSLNHVSFVQVALNAVVPMLFDSIITAEKLTITDLITTAQSNPEQCASMLD